MDNIDNGPTHTTSPHGNNSEHFKDISTPDSETDNATHRHCVSLPVYYNQVQVRIKTKRNHNPFPARSGELCTFASRRGMECMPLRTSSGAYHYHVNDQTKSLQELQNEVGALLEFRDLVIETFPDLKNKMASISASSTGVPSASSLASRREWEPGIRVRRKLTHKETSDIHNSSSLTRSRSNSHSGKKEPKSGEGNNASVIQDSGFSTETSSSKETHSATSTNGAGATTAIGGSNSASGFQRVSSHEAEDELWNLLDVIHRKSTRLRDEMEHLRLMEGDDKSPLSHHHHHHHDQYMAGAHESSNRHLSDMFQLELNRINGEDMATLRKDRDRLLDKLAEMEAEVVAGRIRTNQMEDDVNALNLVKLDLEEQLRTALSQKLELTTRLHDLLSDRNDIPASSYADLPKARQRSSMAVRKLSSPDTSTYHHSNVLGNKISSNSSAVTNNTFSAVIVKSSASSQLPNSKQDSDTNTQLLFGDTIAQPPNNSNNKQQEYTLGRLDGLVSSPNRCSKVRVADSRKIAAILLETNIVELQRHLLTITVQNQALTQRLEQATKSKIYLIKKLDKAKEEIDDLKFQLEERNIELEGTKAQLRVLASKSTKSEYGQEATFGSPVIMSQVSTPSMKAMTPLALDELQNNSSSTESAHDNAERDSSVRGTPSKYRPSKIPLPGSKSYLAPKPPTGRNFVNSRSPSGPPSNKSLNKSTSSLNSRYDMSTTSMQKSSPSASTSPNLYRPESAQSLRKDMSLNNTNRNSSSIPVSTPKASPTRSSPAKNSPVPKTKRESLTSKVRHMDSLSRMHASPSHSTTSVTPTMPQSPIHTTNTATIVGTPTHHHNNSSNSSIYKSNSKKDLSSSFSIGQSRDRKQQNSTNNSPVRRVSSNSFGSKGIDLSNTAEPVEKVDDINGQSVDESPNNPDLIREYLMRTREPPAIFQPSAMMTYNPLKALQQKFVNMAYKHPQLLIGEKDECEKVDSETDEHEIVDNYNNDQNKCPPFKLSLFNGNGHSENSTAAATAASNSNADCRLIGNVKPNLIKTWEQLNSAMTSQSDVISGYAKERNNRANAARHEHMNPMIYLSNNHILFDQKMPTTSKQNESFVIKRPASQSGHFYDSIDNESVVTQDDDDQMIASLCDEMEHGGEAMAEYISLIEKKEKLCWSIDSCN
ncbi:uncharacterized protein LOC129578631 isoform X2 [Sitodiplosis mosellana]|uniref:uncharacterized protein LOC129578631 isoform X2 n=1 Tax=Sitodiplosis mosellana TaxID=263140 RepID=UPI002443F0CB|nr:uncharacterized protein LOC129578631 isoform X2 [Sitodiplosis mosellana]